MKRRTAAAKTGGKVPTAPGEGPGDRQSYVTAEGLERMKEELQHLRTERRAEVADLIRKAKEMGDITDSAQYDAAKDEQAFLEGRIRALESLIGRAVVLEESGSLLGEIRLGSRVTLRDAEGGREVWSIVGRPEANVSQGRISNESPLGRALLGRRVGELVQVQTPGGVRDFSVVSIA